MIALSSMQAPKYFQRWWLSDPRQHPLRPEISAPAPDRS
jgi:hypothetical protein